jgi:hypothetical protein
VALVTTDVSEKRSASFIRFTRIGELGTTLAVASDRNTLPILVTLMMEALRSSKTSDLTRTKQRNVPENCIFHGHRRENLKPYMTLIDWAVYQRRTMFLVKYELGFHIPEDNILQISLNFPPLYCLLILATNQEFVD